MGGARCGIASMQLPLQLLLLALLLSAILCSVESSTLRDAKAVVDREFSYRLIDEGEDGSRVQVFEANQASLPGWLYYSPKSGSLKGVPSRADRGVYIIAVRGLPGSDGSTEDVFALSVVDDAAAAAEVAVPLARADDAAAASSCRQRDTVTMAGFVAAVDLAALSARQRTHLLEDAAAAVGIRRRYVALFSVPSAAASHASSPVVGAASHGDAGWLLPDAADKSVLVAGPGNIAVAAVESKSALATPTTTQLTAVAWVVGCGSVSDDHVGLLADLESTAADGRLARAIGHDVIGWRVANRHQQSGSADGRAGRQRLRRQAGQTAMPDRAVVSTGVPAIQPPPSSASVAGELSRSPVIMSSAVVTLPSASSVLPIRPTAVISAPPPSAVTTTTASTSRPTTEATTAAAAATTTTSAPTSASSRSSSPASTVGAPHTQPATTAAASSASTTAATAKLTEAATTAATSTPAVSPSSTAAASTAAAVRSAAVTSPSSAEQRVVTNATARSTAAATRARTTAAPTSTTTVQPVTPAIKTAVTTTTASKATSTPATSRAPSPTTATSGSSSSSTARTRPAPTTLADTLRAQKVQVIVNAQPERLVREKLPYDTFSKSLDELHIAVTLLNGSALPHNYWVSFRPTDHQVVVLAGRNDVGTHDFLIGAVFKDDDDSTEVAQTRLRVVVKELPPGAPDPAAGASQVFQLTIDANYDELVRSVSAMEQLVAALERLHPNSKVVITSLSRGSVVVSYAVLPDTTSSAVEQDQCDVVQARLANDRLFNPDGSMRSDVQQGMPFKILSMSSTPRGSCEGVLKPLVASPSTAPPSLASTTARQTPPPRPTAANQPPRAIVSSLMVFAERGKELRYELPDNLFSDPEDGAMRHLKLRLVTVDSASHSPIVADASPSSPLQLVSSRGERWHLSGLYYEPVSRSTALRYVLRAADRNGASADVSVQLNITEPSVSPAFVLRAKLTVDVSSFANNVSRQLDFLYRVMHVAGDSSTANLSLLEVRHSLQPTTTPSSSHQQHSQRNPQQATKLYVTWTHTGHVTPHGAAAPACPAEAIRSLVRRFMVDKTITAAAADKKRGLGSFGILSIELEPRQRCLGKVASEVAHLPVAAPPVPEPVAEADGFWLTVVVPVIVIIVLLVVAIIVAAVLISRRRRRSTRANVSGGGANGTFIGKTVPVIFDEEREDGGGDGATSACRTPLMQNEDKTPVPPPPEYPHLYGGGGGAYPEQKQPLMSQQHHADGSGSPGAGSDAMPPYQPPTPPISEPDESSTFPRSGAASSSVAARSQQQNFVPP